VFYNAEYPDRHALAVEFMSFGVSELMKIALQRTRKAERGIKYGICGEHDEDPESVLFWHNIGLDHVSCSPFRLPVARSHPPRSLLKDKI